MIYLNGAIVAKQLEIICQIEHERYKKLFGHPAHMGVISVGENEASQIYIGHKKAKAEQLGFVFQSKNFAKETSADLIIDHIKSWDKSVHGMILQLPVSEGHDSASYLKAIPPEKDIDGLNPCSTVGMIPCTPLGCLLMLKYYGISLEGSHCVVVGRSRLVGIPLANLLLNNNATVTVTHSYTKDLPSLTRQADILFVCAGKKHLITTDYVNEKTIVIDIGIHRTENGITGDVDPEVYKKVKGVSPVPGGVGPMTVMSLMWNTLRAAFLAKSISLSVDDLLKRMPLFDDFS